MVKMEVENIAAIEQDFIKLGKNIAKETRSKLIETGRFVQAEAKKRCPVGPTKSQAAKDPHYNYDKKKSRGSLKNSIVMRRGRDFVDVGVIQGPALKYANYIHNLRNTEGGWLLLGPGSRAKRSEERVGEKFIDRAYDENEKFIEDMFKGGISLQVDRFNNGD